MDILAPFLAAGTAAPTHAPWPRADIGTEIWQRVTLHLAAGIGRAILRGAGYGVSWRR